MKFIKESIEFPSSKTSVRECIHPLEEEERRASRKWGHTWYEDSNYDIVKVKTKDGTVLRRGEPLEAENGDKLVINGFDPDTNTVYVVAADDYDPGFDGGADYAVEDIVKIFKYWDEQPVEDTNVRGPELTTSKELKEAKTRTVKKWGHTWYVNDDNNIERQRVEKVETKNGVTIKLEDVLTDKQGNKYHVNSFQIDDNTASVFNEKTGEDGIRLNIEEVEEMVKNPGYVEEHPAQEYITTFSKDTLNDLPGFPEDMHWYANRYALDFKTSDHSSYYTVTGAKEDVDRFIRDFDIDVFDESLNEEMKHGIYRVTYVEDAGANIFSAVMVRAESELEANAIFSQKLPGKEIIGTRELDDREVENNKKRGMSLLEDLEVGELEHEEAEEGDNPAPPVAGEESAAASLINSLIRDEWTAIEQYNSAMVNLKELEVDEKIIEVLNHIMFDENTHVGNLQEVLKLLAPATDKIEKGNEQAEQILNEEPKAEESEEAEE